MKKFTKILALVLVFVMATSLFTSCGDKKSSVADGEKITVTVAFPGLEQDMKNDELYKFISDKFGLEFEFNATSLDTIAEKGRLWVASGSLPDMMFGDFTYRDYLSWGKQGLVKPLPKDYEKKYPNLASGLVRTKIVEKLKKDGDGVMFGIPRSMNAIYNYGFSDDTPNIDRHGFVYRKDWAKKLGYEPGIIVPYDEFIEMAVAMKKADFGGVGQANNMGVAVTPANAPFIFVHAQNPNWNIFYKNDKGDYVSGYNDDATLTGLLAYKEAYDLGVLHPSFYTHKATDIAGYFHSGKAGMLFQSLGANDFQTVKTKFVESNPGLDPDECVGIMWIEGKDGKVRARETANYWSCLYFKPDIDEEAYSRLLSMIDYFATEEGGRLITSGFEGKDYEIAEDGSIVNLIPQADDGTHKKLSDVYPSATFFVNAANVSYMSTNISEENKQIITEYLQAKLDSDLDTKKLNLDVEFYASDKYVKFASTHDVATIMAEIITGKGDPEKLWKEKVKSLQNKIDEITKELNENLK